MLIYGRTREEWITRLSRRTRFVGRCWILRISRRSAAGRPYPVIHLSNPQRRLIGLNRLALAIFKGFNINSPLLALHSCDRPACWNPRHLRPGTNRDNVLDAAAKGRGICRRLKVCRRGIHRLVGSNVMRRKGGGRLCAPCTRKRWHDSYLKRKRLDKETTG